MNNSKMTQYIIIIFLFTTFLLGCSSYKKEPTEGVDILEKNLQKLNTPTDNLKLTAHLGGTRNQDTSLVIYISTTIENLSLDTIRFLSWTCSYEDLFVVNDTNSFEIQKRFDCFSNVPYFIYLPPKTKTDRYVMIKQLGSQRKIHSSPIRIGMKLIVQKEPLRAGQMIVDYATRKEDGIIWSNELNMSRLYQELYVE